MLALPSFILLCCAADYILLARLLSIIYAAQCCVVFFFFPILIISLFLLVTVKFASFRTLKSSLRCLCRCFCIVCCVVNYRCEASFACLFMLMSFLTSALTFYKLLSLFFSYFVMSFVCFDSFPCTALYLGSLSPVSNIDSLDHSFPFPFYRSCLSFKCEFLLGSFVITFILLSLTYGILI